MAPTAGRLVSDDVFGILCVFAEARGEPAPNGQIAVANVIRNRARKRFRSDREGSICSVVCWPYQFSWLNTHDSQRMRVLSAEWSDPAMDVCARAWFESEHTHLVGEALHYHADYVTPTWARSNRIHLVTQIGRHLFYAED